MGIAVFLIADLLIGGAMLAAIKSVFLPAGGEDLLSNIFGFVPARDN